MDIPALHGNWVDLIILLVVFFYLASGWRRGLFLGLIDLGGFLLSFISAIKFYKFAGSLLILNFSIPKGIAQAAGFLLVGFLTETIVSFFISLFYRKLYLKIFKMMREKYVKAILILDKSLGFIPALGEAAVFTAFILTLIIALPIQGAVKKQITLSRLGAPLVAQTQGIERQLNGIFGEAVSETMNFLTVTASPGSEDKIDLNFTQTSVSIDEAAEATMLKLVNEEREKKGLKKLIHADSVRKLARDYARDMFARGYFSHYNPEGQSPFERMKQSGISFLAAGENLALAPNVTLAHQGLMNSPGHRANILSTDFGHVGIGVIDGGIYGEMYVQEFTD